MDEWMDGWVLDLPVTLPVVTGQAGAAKVEQKAGAQTGHAWHACLANQHKMSEFRVEKWRTVWSCVMRCFGPRLICRVYMYVCVCAENFQVMVIILVHARLRVSEVNRSLFST